jgi:hypothetical protein
MPQASHMIATHGVFAVSAVVIFGQNQAKPRAAIWALNSATTANASRSSADARFIRSMDRTRSCQSGRWYFSGMMF